ncbi:MAG: hypothetical protein AABX23_03900 [Nanoarchaeota archaeon]
MNLKFVFIALMVLAVSLTSMGQSLVSEPETMHSWSGNYNAVPVANDLSASSTPISTVPTSLSTPVSVESTSPVSNSVPPFSIGPSINSIPTPIAPVLIEASASATPIIPAGPRILVTSNPVSIVPVNPVNSMPVPIAPVDSGYVVTSNPVPIAPIVPSVNSIPTSIAPVDPQIIVISGPTNPVNPSSNNNDDNSGRNNNGNGRNSNNNDDESNGRRLNTITLPLEELSTSSEDESDSRFSKITGAVIGVLGNKGALGLGILLVVVGVVGLFVYNRQRFGIVKAN